MAANNHACSSKPRAHSSLHHSPTHHSVLKHMLIASQIHDKLPEGLTLISAEGFKEWFIDLQVLDPNPLYINKTFRLKFTFSDKYPMGISSLPRNPSPYSNTLTTAPPEPPEVVFIHSPDRPIPIHPHIYSNGIICLDLLGQNGWSPVQNVQSISMSLQSMLTGNDKIERPEGDAEFVANNRQRPRDINFYYHDDTV